MAGRRVGADAEGSACGSVDACTQALPGVRMLVVHAMLCSTPCSAVWCGVVWCGHMT